MNYLQFIISLLTLVSIDVFVGIIVFEFYHYFNDKYKSQLEVVTLREENKYLKEQNKKVDGTSTFWEDK